ncbi:methyl-accepting chemotaxis protein [Alishewanella longhuensis]|uniref:Methyl-accepting chemotaxis protein n=1 Tax=Alishewanella longhuensis TaxID=1091037 RepID=A0ABQ3L443_9ALTE|nr:methyl-accepting chemotaxis protein [Alishewanella longhuensis]GHG70444.1 methyl-accepting chemotaxis protein [Alishewanella longhuensis]
MSSLSQLVLNLSVKRKLLSGFAVVLAILLTISTLSFQALSALSERFTLLNNVKSISLLISDARQQEKNFILRGDARYIDEAVALVDQSLGLAGAAIADFSTPESVLLMQTLQQQARNYQQELRNYQRLEQENQSRQQQMEAQAYAAIRSFNQLEQDFRAKATAAIERQGNSESINALRYSQLASDANRALMEARRLERNFIISKDNAVYQALLAQLTVLEQIVPQLQQSSTETEVQQLLTEINQQLNAYRAEFSRFRQLSVQLEASEQQLTEQARAVVSDADSSLERQLERLASEEQQLKAVLMFSSVLALILGITAALIITRMIVKPLQQVVEVADKIADGDLTADLHSVRTDELGQLMQAMQRMTLSLRQLILRLSSGITQLASSTEEMAVISQQTSTGVAQQKMETMQVATAMNEMTATVQDVARSAEEASTAATHSAEQAEFSNRVLDRTMTGIKSLAQEVSESANAISALQEEAASIGEIVSVISGITEQTNLLALNAAIEAARAGEAGRGFSVVADEVRQLANRAQQSTTKISEVIKRLQQKTEQAVLAMQANAGMANDVFKSTDDATAAIEQIISNIRNIQAMNQQIAAAALQQSTVAEEINRSLTNIQVVTEQSSVAIEETAKTSSALSQLGLEQQQLANQFRLSAA